MNRRLYELQMDSLYIMHEELDVYRGNLKSLAVTFGIPFSAAVAHVMHDSGASEMLSISGGVAVAIAFSSYLGRTMCREVNADMRALRDRMRECQSQINALERIRYQDSARASRSAR